VGEAYEEESQLIFLRNRYYDPELGRFISADSEFGSITNPQSLNPYTYVNNNPLNFIDPTGLRSAKACAYPAGTMTKDGESWTGHGFWELTSDNGKVITIGRYPGISNNGYLVDHDEICQGTVTYEWPATDAQIGQIIAAVKEGRYFLYDDNCINGLERGLKVLGVEHPNLRTCGASVPSKAVTWLKSLNESAGPKDALQNDRKFVQDPDSYMRTLNNKPQVPISTRSSGDVGGVSLNKTAKLLGHISDVEGATYDDATGQLIMIGKKNLSLPEMDFDDLAVAVRSIYGLGKKAPQNPGVSLDWDPEHPVDIKKIVEKGKTPPPMLARYDGQTKNTRFGWIMFEADRVLKSVSLGIDNISGKRTNVKIPGYECLPDRYEKHKSSKEKTETRLWFIPKEVIIHKNRKGNALVFKKAKMEVLTETKYKHRKSSNSEAEKFADHFTEHYGHFAKYYPILNELKRLGKITAVVKWMKENNIPLDLSLFKKYKPAYYETPKKTPAMCITRKDKKNDVITSVVGVVGGVIYHLDESNFHEVVSEDANPLSEAALNARPSEDVFMWTFKSPLDSQEYQAVAQTIERTIKVGNIKKARLDMRFPGSGDYPLELVRYYNSFNDKNIGFGRGWDIVCTGLRFPRSKMSIKWKTEPAPTEAYPEIFVEEDGRESRYVLFGLGEHHYPVYKSNEGEALLAETAKGYILNNSEGKRLTFNSDGKIVSKGKINREQLTYHYNLDNQLETISHINGKIIRLTYHPDRIAQAIGPGGKFIQYGYDSKGQLSQVVDSLGVIENYTYDSDKNLNAILNSQNEPIFNAVYDDYHRATSEIVLGEKQTKNFDLKARTLNVEKIGQNSFCQYDSNYRLLQASDSENRMVKMTYEEGQVKPATISDCLGNEKHYSYDSHGNIIRIRDSVGVEQRFWYSRKDQLSANLDGMGKAELYSYDDQDRLVKVCHLAKLISEDIATGTANFGYSQNYVTEYEYDSNTGLLQKIKQEGDLVQSYSYDHEGMLIGISSPSGHTLQRRYDERGRMRKLCDAQEVGYEYDYDERDRISKLSNPEGMIEYRYDDIGNLSSIQDACGGITSYSYDSFGNLSKITDPMDGVSIFEYDGSHNLKRINLPNSTVREIDYDALNLPKAANW